MSPRGKRYQKGYSSWDPGHAPGVASVLREPFLALPEQSLSSLPYLNGDLQRVVPVFVGMGAGVWGQSWRDAAVEGDPLQLP